MGFFDRFTKKPNAGENFITTAVMPVPIKADIIPVAPQADSAQTAVSGGFLNSEQAFYEYEQFFDKLLRLDTDQVLAKVGMSRSNLSTLLFYDEIDEKVERRYENLSQAHYTLHPSDGTEAEFVYAALAKYFDTLVAAAMDAKLYGYSVCELWLDDTIDGDFLDKLKFMQKPLEWFEPKRDGSLVYYANGYSSPVQVDNIYRFLVMQHKPTYQEPKGKALLSRVYWLWYFKTKGWQFWSKFLERFGSPLLVGSTALDTQVMAQALMNAHNQSIISVGADDKVEAITNSGNGETFKAYDDAIDRRLAKYLLGQTLTSGTDKGGTYGQGKVHQEQQQIIFDSDKIFATKYIQVFINRICEFMGYAPPQFSFIYEKGLQQGRADRDKVLNEQGVNFSKAYYIDNYDFDESDIVSVLTTTPSSSSGGLMPTGNDFKKFSASDDGQAEIDKLGDSLLADSVLPIDKQIILNCMQQAGTPSHLYELLADSAGDKLDNLAFTKKLQEALAVAQLRGYVDAGK